MLRATHTALALILAIAIVSPMADTPAAQSPEPIRYTLRFPAPHTHYVEVEAVYPTERKPEVELMMAVWTPGSYLVREYERHVEALTAAGDGGRPLGVMKPAKNRWRVTTGGAPAVTVRYRVYGREMTVRTNWIESGFAMLNGAPTFLTLPDALARPHVVTLDLPAGWRSEATPLMPVAGRPHTYQAENFDTLVDSPIIAGNPVIRTFEVDGKAHHLVLEGDPSLFDADRAAGDVRKIVEAGKAVMGRLDYPHYFFLNMVTEAGGGLEHKNAFLTMSSRFATRTRRAYVGWLHLVGHEYFHNWNIKRLRPVELGPFDYEHENYTKGLWVGEGFTDYYGALLVRRAGLSTLEEYLDELSGSIERVQMRGGRAVQSVDMASFDTWIKQYRPDENSTNTSIDYYDKGATIAFLLDAKIRKATAGARTLDAAMRLAYERFSGAKGYTPEQFQGTMGETAGQDLKGWFADVAGSTKELDFTEALDFYGLRFAPVDPKNARATMGASTRSDGGRLVVTVVRRNTPAYDAGLNVDDEILAIDDVRVRADGLTARMDQYKAGDRIRLLVARRDRLTTLDVTLAPEPGRPWRLQVRPDQTAEQKARLAAWLGL
ncbi:MAG: M61 family metallopeptidase [Vicinamibacterales bacterium]